MTDIKGELDKEIEWAGPVNGLQLYALTDPAMDRGSHRRLLEVGAGDVSLLSTLSAPDEASPHLVWLGPLFPMDTRTRNLLEREHASAAFTVLVSALSLDLLRNHLGAFADVTLPGQHDMLLAIWDPAILATLVGQADDFTLHVPGPVLTAPQRKAMLAPIHVWWYRDRESNWHRIEGGKSPNVVSVPSDAALPLTLNQEQEDALVEASVPDQVIYHLEQNRPTLFDQAPLPREQRYRFVHQVLKAARQLGLQGMRDLVNFVALCLIYQQRMGDDPQIVRLLDQIQRKSITMDEAMELMPE